MASKSDRDRLFPATSIGRTQGTHFQREPSHDSLSAHPLLSTGRSPSPSPVQSTDSSPSPRYVPYTPRQRVSPTAATTGTTVHPSSPQHQHEDATSKLQLVNLKAAAQTIGLDSASLGWAMLEKLAQEHDYRDGEWVEVCTALFSKKAVLLLPLEPSSYDKLTPEFFKDHIALCDGPSRKDAPIITLSGIRGTLHDETLTFRSSIHPSSKIYQDILSPSTRPSALKALPDLPPISQTHLTKSYPTFTLPSYSFSLPIPPRAQSSLPAKPPLPPRPGNRTSSNASTASRITNPFASLFGGGGGSNLHSKTANTAAPPSPTASVRSMESMSAHTDSVIEVCAFTIDRKVTRRDVAKSMNKALRHDIMEALGAGERNLPSWVVDRVHDFTARWYPFVKNKNVPSSSSSSNSRMPENEGGNSYVVTWAEEAPEKMAARMQDFYMALEHDLRILEGSFSSRFRERRKDGEKESDDGTQDDQRVKDKIDSETKIKDVVDTVERTICSLFYDRLYMQPNSDDSSHDEALSSRVAALNMLDLSLEHLDLKVEHATEELDVVVRACGETLSQLQACRSPGDKGALLVSAHKIIVDGLSRLPPIRLMTEEESKFQKAKTSSATEDKAEAPPREPDGTLRILMPLPLQVPSIASATDPLGIAETSTSLLFEAPPGTGSDVGSAVPREPGHQPLSIPTIVKPGSEAKSNQSNLHSDGSGSPTSANLAQPPPNSPTPVSGDVLLPMIIFSVVKANPPHLVSSLLYTQRYRNQSVAGEESYCLINLLAVAEFLENVDLAALGLGNIDKVLSAADLTPIPLNRSPMVTVPPITADGIPGSIRDRVEQANKVITGVVDSSFGMIRSLLPNTAPVAPPTPAPDGVQNSAPWNAAKPGFGLLRRESGFSIKSLTAALPINRGKVASGEETGQQLVAVSRPASVKSAHEVQVDAEESDSEETSDAETGNEDEDDEQLPEQLEHGDASAAGEVKGIKSFESMMSKKRRRHRPRAGTRKSLTDRLAHMSNLAGLKDNTNIQSTQPHSDLRIDSGFQPSPPDIPALRLAPPIQRFVDCSLDDLRLSEVGELLRDYRRLVEAIRAVKGFDE